MSINVQDTFKVNISLPIDSRIVASNSTVRDAIQYKYDGLSVFQTNDRKTYVWNSSPATWSSADITGAGDSNHISRFSSTFGLTSSALYMKVGSGSKKGNIGINTTDPKDVFQVNTDTGVADPMVVSVATNTLIGFNWWNNGTDQTFTNAQPSAAIKFRRTDGSIHILSRAASTSALNSTDTFNSNILARFTTAQINFTKDVSMNNNNGALSAAYLRGSNGYSLVSTPDYTWLGDLTTGIYHPSASRIGFTIGGAQKAILTSTGLLVGDTGGPLTVPNHYFNLNGNNGASAVMMQFTNGTTTGVAQYDSFLIGIDGASGERYWPQLQSRYQNTPILIRFANGVASGGNNFYKIARNLFTIYSNDLGTGFNDQKNNLGPRTIIGTKGIEFAGQPQGTYTIYTLSVPNNCFISLECTFNTTNIYGASTKNFRIHKLLGAFKCNSSGTVTVVGSTDTQASNSSPSTTTISGATIVPGGANSIDMKVQFVNTGGNFSGYSLVSFRATINTYQGG